MPVALTNDTSLWVLVILFVTGIVAGFVDSIAGGGGLLTLPVLLGVHFPPQLALGTNKLQASFGSGSAAVHFTRKGLVSPRECVWGVVYTVIGAAFGSGLVLLLDPALLKKLIPLLLLAIAGCMFFKPKLGEAETTPRMSLAKFYPLAGLGLGFYDGFIGPGTGTFWTMAFMLGMGCNLTRATAHTKVMNFASNLVSLIFFASTRRVLIIPGVAMGIGQWLGAWAGSHMVVTRGTKFIRPIFLTMVLAVTIKLIYDSYLK
jgi:uncharacterized membrane protein YfcA